MRLGIEGEHTRQVNFTKGMRFVTYFKFEIYIIAKQLDARLGNCGTTCLRLQILLHIIS